MRKKLAASFITLCALFLVLSTFTAGAQYQSATIHKDLHIASVHGDLDFSLNKEVTVIVELTEQSIVEAKHSGISQSKAKLKQAREDVIAEIDEKTSNSQVNHEYDYVFSGFSLQIKASEIPHILTIPGVKAVYPNVEYTALETGVELPADAYSPHMMDSAPFIGSEEAWDAGFTGKGVTVAIIDTGVDYTHPDLAHAFGDYKGWDLVDNDNDPQETPVGDPRGNSTTHGTHVAGTVAANGLIKGVAPDATLLAYRVLGPGGSGTTQNVVAGIERAVQDGADVMNLSLGNSVNSPDWATSIALDWAMAEGVVAVTSNGNSGPNNWTVGSPGTSREAISVGATQLPYNVFTAKTMSSDGVSYASSAVQGHPSEEALLALNGKDFKLVDVGFGAPGDFVGKDLTGKIALISRGAGIPFVDKASEAKKAGAVGAILYNNVAGTMPNIPGMAVPTIMLSQADGLALLAKVNEVTVSFEIDFSAEVGETVADFSSRGPVTSTWMIKPDVSAPGVNITSTVPTHNPANPYGYAAFQGTSMAAPHVAGAAALILQANQSWGVYEVKSALMNTAEDMINPATGKSYPYNTQGAGSIRVLDAIKTETLVLPGSYSFGIFERTEGTQLDRQQFQIKNTSNKAKQYSVKFNFNREVGSNVRVSTTSTVRVNPGVTQNVNLSVMVNGANLQPGYYEGYLTVTEGGKVIEVPTILFIGQPDYPRVTLTGVTALGNNNFEVYAHLPGGADSYELAIYRLVGSQLAYLGDVYAAQDIKEHGIYEHNWNGTFLNGSVVPNGTYYLVAWVTKGDRTDYAIIEPPVTIRR
ncbi:S8 family serine peptidase [Bacillus sp. FJAT-45066]|uniref:S8 family serine peptidase n=1 Tax=Bacillus sp. FJAT-45066 TaxID=2011010 RepID=UPI000BB80F1C|nr:S8 family serine peptidase [Bacillus sp. FJAT-45066]